MNIEQQRDWLASMFAETIEDAIDDWDSDPGDVAAAVLDRSDDYGADLYCKNGRFYIFVDAALEGLPWGYGYLCTDGVLRMDTAADIWYFGSVRDAVMAYAEWRGE